MKGERELGEEERSVKVRDERSVKAGVQSERWEEREGGRLE